MDQLLYGLSVTLIGMVIVFIGLIILIGCVKLLTLGKGKKKDETPAPSVKVEPIAPAAPTAVPVSAVQSDDALIAVITAAVACMLEGDTGFVVRKVRRINNSPAWHTAGRDDQIYSRL